MDDEDDEWAGANAALERFGLPARPAARLAIIAALEEQVRLVESENADDAHLMRLLCAQLFSLGVVEDALLVWRAKQCNFDTHCGIDVSLLCGGGLEETKAFLASAGTEESVAALDYLRHCEGCGNFAGFDVAAALADLRRFYEVDP